MKKKPLRQSAFLGNFSSLKLIQRARCCRFKRLRGPASSFIINLAIADLANSLLHSMAATSSFRGRWSFGATGLMRFVHPPSDLMHIHAISIITHMRTTCETSLDWISLECAIDNRTILFQLHIFLVPRDKLDRFNFASYCGFP